MEFGDQANRCSGEVASGARRDAASLRQSAAAFATAEPKTAAQALRSAAAVFRP